MLHHLRPCKGDGSHATQHGDAAENARATPRKAARSGLVQSGGHPWMSDHHIL